MVFSYYLAKPVYTLWWRLLNLFSRRREVVFYCAEMIDYYSFAPVLKLLSGLTFASSNPAVKKDLAKQGIAVKSLPVFPKAVIMCRHATHKFPCSRVLKIGLRHGPYHFKRLTKAANYNQFDLYFFSSEADLRAAEAIGVTVGKAIGFPRLDPAFNGDLLPETIPRLRKELKLDPTKPTLLFTATWDKSGMSGLSLWFDRLSELTPDHNVLVTTHPWTERRYLETIQSTPGVHFIRSADLLPYISLADICIGDTSSLLAECCALHKSIIIFRTSKSRRSLEEIDQLLAQMSLAIHEFAELKPSIRKCLETPGLLREGQQKANAIMFDTLDGKAGERAAAEIIKLLPELKP